MFGFSKAHRLVLEGELVNWSVSVAAVRGNEALCKPGLVKVTTCFHAVAANIPMWFC